MTLLLSVLQLGDKQHKQQGDVWYDVGDITVLEILRRKFPTLPYILFYSSDPCDKKQKDKEVCNWKHWEVLVAKKRAA
jgi:hypothetical protein